MTGAVFQNPELQKIYNWLDNQKSAAATWLIWADSIWEPRYERNVQSHFDSLRRLKTLMNGDSADYYLGVVAAGLAIELLTAYPEHPQLTWWRKPIYDRYGENLAGYEKGVNTRFIMDRARAAGADALSDITSAFQSLNVTAASAEPEVFTVEDLQGLDAWKSELDQIQRANDVRSGAW
ncbi:hypothetical protein [Cupriavidus metallidurans]|uniref:hypothetical protein n=1 Tax=Cupriavidus metallidurans TaxID=119219 RepID=UPI001CC93FC0|nr:hypothetical protein [Cupriavidus metallidurans]UBM12780.1 hypothetical protein LAI70_27900 [Cupriavidus metallidurans]